jgi:hypothetical protein
MYEMHEKYLIDIAVENLCEVYKNVVTKQNRTALYMISDGLDKIETIIKDIRPFVTE